MGEALDRDAWIAERRAAVVAEYDTLASSFDDDPYPNDAQRGWVERLLGECSAGGVVLDAPCGTGRYFAQVIAAGCVVVGIDQSAGMLAQARTRNPAVELHHLGLQELSFVGRFGAAMTIDAMENVTPEEWPIVLANMHRALRANAYWYLTVEEQDRTKIERIFAALAARGVPAVIGEVVGHDVAGYHYYPERTQVLAWIEDGGFAVVDEGYTDHDGWGYRHFLLAVDG